MSNFKNMLEADVYRQIFRNHFRIPKYGSTVKVPFELNAMQSETIDGMDYYNMILKARKEGFSTLILGLALVNCNEIPNYHSVFLADNEKNTKAIFTRAKDMVDGMINLDGTPMNTDHIEMTTERITNHRTNSYTEIATAGSKSAFRGSDIHLAHLSEIAFFKYPDVYEAVVEAGAAGMMVFFESTANGRNVFNTLWNKAQDYPKKSAYKPFFFGWNRHPMYAIPVPQGFKRTSQEVEYCTFIKEVFDIELSDSQLAWKRYKLITMPNPDKFPQEYPLTAEEAFLSSGKPVFNQKKLGHMKALAPDYRMGSIDLDRLGSLSWVDESTKSYWKIFEEPKPGKEFVIGADTAEGIQGGDFNAAFVLDPETWCQIAEFHGNLDPDQFAYELNKGGRYFNNAILAVERNNHGYTVNSRLYDSYDYPRLYQEEKDVDTMTVQATMNYGFRTTLKTRPIMVDVTKRLIRRGALKINSVECIDECLSFITNAVGKAEAEVGMHDDRVMAMMIACYISDRYPEVRQSHNMPASFRYNDTVQNLTFGNRNNTENRGGY